MKSLVSITFPLRWGEMDALGHVNNTIYFKYFEHVRLAYFEKLNMGELMQHTNLGPILANISCQFMRPLVYPDTITVSCWVEKIGNTSLQMDYQIKSEKQGEIVAKGSSIIVMMNYVTSQKVKVSEEVKQKINNLAVPE